MATKLSMARTTSAVDPPVESVLVGPDPSWHGLYRAGGIAAILYLLLLLTLPTLQVLVGPYDFSMDAPTLLEFIGANRLWCLTLQTLVLGASILAISDFTDAEDTAAIVRITGGNFRLIQRLLNQVERVMRINELRYVTKDAEHTFDPDCPAIYQIIEQGYLDESRSDWFDGMAIEPQVDADGRSVTKLTGKVIDQAALHGLVRNLYDLGLSLLSVNRIEHE